MDDYKSWYINGKSHNVPFQGLLYLNFGYGQSGYWDGNGTSNSFGQTDNYRTDWSIEEFKR